MKSLRDIINSLNSIVIKEATETDVNWDNLDDDDTEDLSRFATVGYPSGELDDPSPVSVHYPQKRDLSAWEEMIQNDDELASENMSFTVEVRTLGEPLDPDDPAVDDGYHRDPETSDHLVHEREFDYALHAIEYADKLYRKFGNKKYSIDVFDDTGELFLTYNPDHESMIHQDLWPAQKKEFQQKFNLDDQGKKKPLN